MRLRERRARRASRLRHPQATVRWRLTLLYGGLFLVSGAILLAITYTLVAHAAVTGPNFHSVVAVSRPPGNVTLVSPAGQPFVRDRATAQHLLRQSFVPPAAQPRAASTQTPVPFKWIKQLLGSRVGRVAAAFVGSDQRVADLHQLEIESVIALAIMAVLSGGLGWLVAGRVLRPLRTMTVTTRQISEVNLHERLAMPGPRDELRTLADTIDGLLGRLEGAFDAQRRFVANASHELRTPLTAARALLEMVISDPHATVETYRETCEQVLEEGEQQEQLIDALLALARGQRGLDRAELLDLGAITGDVVQTHQLDMQIRGLRLDVSLEPVLISGDRRLIERLASNLVDNALRHNTSDGHVQIRVRVHAGNAVLGVANTGPLVPADEIDRLLAPFQRLGVDRTGHRDGLGLGLSIVAAIATAHRADLDVRPGAEGGLRIVVRFPLAPDSGPRAAAGALLGDTPAERGPGALLGA